MKNYAQLLIRDLNGNSVETPAKEINDFDKDIIESAVTKLAPYFDMTLISQLVAEGSSYEPMEDTEVTAPMSEKAAPQQYEEVPDYGLDEDDEESATLVNEDAVPVEEITEEPKEAEVADTVEEEVVATTKKRAPRKKKEEESVEAE